MDRTPLLPPATPDKRAPSLQELFSLPERARSGYVVHEECWIERDSACWQRRQLLRARSCLEHTTRERLFEDRHCALLSSLYYVRERPCDETLRSQSRLLLTRIETWYAQRQSAAEDLGCRIV